MSGGPLRRVILRLADHPGLRRWVTAVGPRLGAYRFVAGDRPEDARAVVRSLADQGLCATLDHLGEAVTEEAAARRAGRAYLELLALLEEAQLPAHISLKLTQMGVDLSPELCQEVVVPILRQVDRMGSFCRLDMEDSAHTDITLDLYARFREVTPRVGVVLQAYLYRTPEDLRRISGPGVNVRLVKGAYLEPPDRAFPRKQDVDRRYLELVRESLSLGNFTAVATHDERLIRQVLAWVRKEGIPRSRYEFQMLYGIRSRRQRELAAEGEAVRIYVPYGPDWYAYFMRRLAERPANLWFFLTGLVRP